MKSRRIHKIINIVLVAAFLIAAFNIGKIYYDYGKADSTYNGLQKEYVAANKAPESIEIPQEKETAPITIAFDELMVRNKDVAGWLYCPDSFAELLAEYQEKSTFTSNVTLEPTDAIITLSTCSYEFSNARYIVIGRLTSL